MFPVPAGRNVVEVDPLFKALLGPALKAVFFVQKRIFNGHRPKVGVHQAHVQYRTVLELNPTVLARYFFFLRCAHAIRALEGEPDSRVHVLALPTLNHGFKPGAALQPIDVRRLQIGKALQKNPRSQ